MPDMLRQWEGTCVNLQRSTADDQQFLLVQHVCVVDDSPTDIASHRPRVHSSGDCRWFADSANGPARRARQHAEPNRPAAAPG